MDFKEINELINMIFSAHILEIFYVFHFTSQEI